MITPEQWDLIGKQASKIYSELELEIIQEIAERIANVGYANTVVLNDVLIAEEMGVMYQDIINLVAKYNNTSASQIQEIFETAGVKSLEYDDKIYKLAGLKPVPLKQSSGMWHLLEATALKTNNNLNNLVMTTASSAQTQFYKAMNKAYMEVSTGVKSYSQSIMDAIKDISNQGAYITYPGGQHRSIESATRMNIVTSVNQTCGKLQEMRADELGWDLMELTAHAGARPEHAEWQGRIVSRSGKKGYLSLDDIGYGEVTGFKGVNCRHDWRPYYEGSSLTYTEKELQEINNATVEYNGQKIPLYDAQQMQRKAERIIRQDKKDIASLQGILTSNNKDAKLIEETKIQLANAQNKLKQHNSILNNFTEQTGLRKDYTRLIISTTKANKNDIIQANYIRKTSYTSSKNIDTQIKSAFKKLPDNIKQLGESVDYKVISKGNSYYSVDNNTVYLLKGSNKYEILHEIGHIIEVKKDIYNDARFKEVLLNGIENIDLFDDKTIGSISGYDSDKYEFLKIGDKFVSDYQRRLYNEDMYKNPRIDYLTYNFNHNVMRDYFSEGFRCYFEDNKLLKRKDKKLYDYIEVILNE